MSLAQTIDRGFQLALLVQQVKKIVPAFRNHPFAYFFFNRRSSNREKDRSDQTS